jgi:hypothetical protein
MANPNPHKARRAKRAKAKPPGTINDVKARVWTAIEAAAEILAASDTDPALRLRAVHAVTQAAGSYTKILESAEFEARLRALEEKLTDGSVI